jgi:hypothetical protein
MLEAMIKPYKKRIIRTYEPVEVYRNVNIEGVWYSVRQRGKVVAHVTEFSLKDCEFVVQEAGRKRAKKRKNVHAWVKGYPTNYAIARIGKRMTRVIYDPKAFKNFVTWKGHKKVKKAHTAVLFSGGVVACLD